MSPGLGLQLSCESYPSKMPLATCSNENLLTFSRSREKSVDEVVSGEQVETEHLSPFFGVMVMTAPNQMVSRLYGLWL